MGSGGVKIWRGPRATSLAAALALSGCAATERTSADRFAASGELIALSGGDAGAFYACFSCHGLDGMGNGAGAPRLAGLDAGYLQRQMEAYAAGLRRHPEMEEVAAKLGAGERRSVSAHYAAMSVRAALPSPRSAPGLWALGDPRRGLEACAACHGLEGEGAGPGSPPLAQQPAAYLADQLHKWRSSERRNDPGNVMLAISRRLDSSEIAALAAYAGSLPAAAARPVYRAAFPAAHRADPRNDVSGRRPHEAVP